MKLIKRIKKYYGGGYIDPYTLELVLPTGYNPNNFQYYMDPSNPKNTYVRLDQAADAELPLYINDPSSAAFDYGIIDNWKNNVRHGKLSENSNDEFHSTLGGNRIDPTTTYVQVDPQNRVLNTGMNSLIINGSDMVPMNNDWWYTDYSGWSHAPKQDQLYDADKMKALNSLRNLNEEFGLALGAQVPFNANPELLEGSMSVTKPLVQFASSVYLGGGMGKGAQAIATSAKGIPLWLGRTATAGLLATEAAPAYADWAKADEVSKIGNYLNSINNFTGKDFETLVSAYGKDKAVAMLLGWIEAQKYAVSSSTGKVNQNSVFTVNNVQEPEWFSATNPNATFYLKDPNNLILGGMLGTAMFPTGKNAKFSASKAKWALLGLEALAYAYLTYDKHQKNFGTSQNVKKAQQIVETLNSLGYNFYGDLGNKQQSYSVQTNSQGQPQIDSTATPATPSGVMDSVPSVISEDINASEEQPRPSWLHNLEAATVDSTSNQ